ncbi:leucine-rich repeat domain-containing protein [bacterium]|nr:leucine-rich repeat domain-containing protein [bacterium]
MTHAIAVDATVKENGEYIDGTKIRVRRHLIGNINPYVRVRRQKTASKIDSLEIQALMFRSGFVFNNLKSVTFKRDNVRLYDESLAYSKIEHIELPKNGEFYWAVFRNCQNLKSANIPERMSDIPNAAFMNDTNLTSLRIDGPIESMGASCLCGCQQLDFKIPETVTSIGNHAMAELANQGLVIPRACKFVGDQAFRYMKNLKHVVIENPETNIHTDAFWDCRNIENVHIANETYAVKYLSPKPHLILRSECVHGIDIMTLAPIVGKPEEARHLYYIPNSSYCHLWDNRDEALRGERRDVMKKYYQGLAKMPVDHRMDISLQELHCIGVMPEQENPEIKSLDCTKCQQMHPAIYHECMNRYFQRSK